MHRRRLYLIYYSFTLLLFCVACNDKKVSDHVTYANTLTPYDSILASNSNVMLENDSLFLGFRLGMNSNQVREHMQRLIDLEKIVIKNNRVYAVIPLPVYSGKDNNGVRNIIAELNFHFDKKKSTLASIKGILYCRYFRNRQWKWDDNDPVLSAMRRVIGDSAYNERKQAQNKPEIWVENLSQFLNSTLFDLLELYKVKYGYERSIFDPNAPEVIYYWIDQGRLIEAHFKRDLKKVAEEHINDPTSRDSSDFSKLIEVGKLNYSTPSTEQEFQASVAEGAENFGKMLDSFYLKEKQDAENAEKERASKSGI